MKILWCGVVAMKGNVLKLGMIATLFALLSGCSGLLPTARSTTEPPWKNYGEAKRAFDSIEPAKTSVAELTTLGFDINKSPNLKVLNYLDIAARVQSIPLAELDPGLQACLRARSDCQAYLFEPRVTKSRRIGNFWLDLFNFQRKIHETGWQFRALLVLVDNRVSYKLWSGTPKIDELRDQRNPLGPLQDASGMLLNIR